MAGNSNSTGGQRWRMTQWYNTVDMCTYLCGVEIHTDRCVDACIDMLDNVCAMVFGPCVQTSKPVLLRNRLFGGTGLCYNQEVWHCCLILCLSLYPILHPILRHMVPQYCISALYPSTVLQYSQYCTEHCMHTSFCMPTHMPKHMPAHMPIQTSTHISVHMPKYMPTHMSIHISVHMSTQTIPCLSGLARPRQSAGCQRKAPGEK